ncbi:MAG: hypothetical protein PVSMB7_27870 [Chloroflexota bacterium]
MRGGMGRGVRVQLGANLTFAVLLVGLAFGIAILAPSGNALRIVEIVGGLFLVWIAVDGFRAEDIPESGSPPREALPPAARGVLAVLLNPAVWLFMATAASSLLSSASHAHGRTGALAAAIALALGLMLGDGVVVLIGGLGVRRAGSRVGLWVRRGLAVVIGILGIGLVVNGILS